MEKRFLHPALQSNELFTVMVHKKQEALARDVLSAYPWFNIKAVKEEHLNFDPNRDRARGDAWETASLSSSHMLDSRSTYGQTLDGGASTYGQDSYAEYHKLGTMAERAQMSRANSDVSYKYPYDAGSVGTRDRSGSDLAGYSQFASAQAQYPSHPGAVPVSELGYGYPSRQGSAVAYPSTTTTRQHSSDNLLTTTDGYQNLAPARKPSVREYNANHVVRDDPVAVLPLLHQQANESESYLPGQLMPLARQESAISSSGFSTIPYPPVQQQQQQYYSAQELHSSPPPMSRHPSHGSEPDGGAAGAYYQQQSMGYGGQRFY